MTRYVEAGVGILAALLGVAGWLWAVFGPTYAAGTYSTGVGAPPVTLTTPGSLAQVHDIGGGPIVYLVVLLACALAVGVGAYLHGGRGLPIGAPILWTATLVLICGVLLSLYTVGPFIAPGAAIAVVACVASAWRRSG